MEENSGRVEGVSHQPSTAKKKKEKERTAPKSIYGAGGKPCRNRRAQRKKINQESVRSLLVIVSQVWQF